MKIKIFREKGFTLIELLIVIAIIGVLSSLLMANFIGVRQRARDAQRKSDLRQIQSALELHRSDNGNYVATGSFPTCGNQLDDGGTPATVYMTKIPCDPLGSSAVNNGNYFYTNTGSGYVLVACLENTSDGQAVDWSQVNTDGSSVPQYTCSSSDTNYYELTNP